MPRPLALLLTMLLLLSACTSSEQPASSAPTASVATAEPTTPQTTTTSPPTETPSATTSRESPSSPLPSTERIIELAPGEQVDELLGVTLPRVEGYRFVELPESVSDTLRQSLGQQQQALEDFGYLGVQRTDGQSTGFILASTLRDIEPGSRAFRQAQRAALRNASPDVQITDRTIAGTEALVGRIAGGALYSWSVDDVVMVTGGSDAEAAEAVATAIIEEN
ncbi:MAG: hypothetical protein ACR2MA_11110 [Egibacteraceae bacterium]